MNDARSEKRLPASVPIYLASLVGHDASEIGGVFPSATSLVPGRRWCSLSRMQVFVGYALELTRSRIASSVCC